MGKVSRKKLKISDNLVYAVLVISGLNFMLRGIYILGVFALIYIAFNHSFIKTKAIIPIAVFGVFYSLFYTVLMVLNMKVKKRKYLKKSPHNL